MALATITLTSIVFLAAFLTYAGLSKLLDLDEFSAAIIGFGLPNWSAKSLGLFICVTEIWTSAFLLFLPSAFIGATTAAILFAAFGAAIASNLALGRMPSCRCFGRASSDPISWRSLIRVLALLGLALALGWQAYIDPIFGVRSLLASLKVDVVLVSLLITIVGGAMAALLWCILHLFRQNGRILLRLEALDKPQRTPVPAPATQPDNNPEPIRRLAPRFELPNQDGNLVTLDDILLDQLPVMLVFVSPRCGPCHQLLPDVAQWQVNHAAEMRFVLIGERPRAQGTDMFDGLRNVLFEDRRAVSNAYHITGTPSAVIILQTGHVGDTIMMGAEAIRRYITTTYGVLQQSNSANDLASFGEHKHPNARSIGMRLPEILLPTESGELVSTRAFRGITVFLFWDPRCGFCEQMAPELSRWESETTAEAPALVIVSSAPTGLTSMRAKVVVDVDFRLGGACAITGTPSALAADGEGAMLEPVAQGSKSILELLHRLKRRSGPRDTSKNLHAVGIV